MTTLAQEAPRRNNSRSPTDDVEPILIAEWPLSRGEIARVAIRSFKGTWLIDLRKWFEAGDGQWRAG
ncbi:transcriptional coactivator p15/PC4 family protein, partial [Salmonella enterica]|uniref:transcriptional coactivator p15/PC4 family protein n=2 Tax=Pseudomonadota TaxID=1224 RepID=UPI003CF9663E